MNHKNQSLARGTPSRSSLALGRPASRRGAPAMVALILVLTLALPVVKPASASSLAYSPSSLHGAEFGQHIANTVFNLSKVHVPTPETEAGQTISRATPASPTAAGVWQVTMPRARLLSTCLLDSPMTPSDWRVVMCDTFDSNANHWPTQDVVDEYSRIRFRIGDGAYRWKARALQEFFSQTVYPDMQPVSDFYASVEATKLSGPDDVDIRLRFRRANAANSYTFGIDETKHFWVNMLYRGDWEVLIDATPTELIRPGESNRLAVKAVGSSFTFYINDEQVAQLTDHRLKRGLVGLVAGLPIEGDQAEFEFRNFEVRAP